MVTQTHSPFETLARVIEHLDDDGRSVRRTEAAGGGDGGALRATVDVSVDRPSGGAAGLEPVDAAVDDGLSVTFRAPSFTDPAEALPVGFPQVSTAATDVWLDADSVVVRLAVTIGDADPPAAADTPGSGDAADAAGTEGAAGGADAPTAATGSRPTDADGGGGEASTPTDTDSERAEAAAGVGTDTTEEADADPEGPSPLSAVRDESVPPYDDTPYLRRLYETCETFAEMSDRIAMDVSAETVRRYMTEAGVHSPTSYETAGAQTSSDGTAADAEGGSEPAADPGSSTGAAVADEADDPADPADHREATGDSGDEHAASLPDEQLVADGIGLPEELTLRDLVDAVVDARTVHEVQREIGLGYDRTRQLLTQLNVLDLVMGRVDGEPDRTVTVDVVADRIRQRTPDTA